MLTDNEKWEQTEYGCVPTDAYVNEILRGMGVDVDKKKPPHWIQDYYTSRVHGKVKNGYICSRCGKHSSSKKDVCDGCNSIMKKE